MEVVGRLAMLPSDLSGLILQLEDWEGGPLQERKFFITDVEDVRAIANFVGGRKDSQFLKDISSGDHPAHPIMLAEAMLHLQNEKRIDQARFAHMNRGASR